MHIQCMQRYWFKQKRYGYGAAPSSWQGWALTIGYVVVLAAMSAWLTERAVRGESSIWTFLALVTVVTIIFLAICWRTTEGGWRWRWGDKD